MKKLHLVIKTNAYDGKQSFYIFSKMEKAAEFSESEQSQLIDDNWAEFETVPIKVDSEEAV